MNWQTLTDDTKAQMVTKVVIGIFATITAFITILSSCVNSHLNTRDGAINRNMDQMERRVFRLESVFIVTPLPDKTNNVDDQDQKADAKDNQQTP